MRRLVPFLVFLGCTLSTHAANVFVRQGATGNNSGVNWTNAMTSIPSSSGLARGNVYYIADGSYTFPTPLSTPAAGTQTIEFRKCSTTDSVSSQVAGYQAAYCDGKASFNSVKLDSSYWIFDGAYRNESSWNQASAYGFQIDEFETRSDFGGTDRVADNVTVKYVDIGPDDGTSNNQGYEGAVLYFGGFDRLVEGWVFQRNYIHNGRAMGQMAGVHNLLFEYNWIAKNWEKTGFRGQIRASSVVFRYNVFKDVCQGNGFDPSSGLNNCTAILGWYGNSGSNNENYSNSQIYGNVFLTNGVHYSDAVIFMGDNRASQGGGPQNCSGCKVLNNTFVGMRDSTGAVGLSFLGTKTNTEARNNIWYDVGSNTPSCTAAVCTNNTKITSAGVFVNAASGNFHLSSNGAAGNGFAVSAPYNKDMDGVTRGANGWDIGAFEFGGNATAVSPSPPTNLEAF